MTASKADCSGSPFFSFLLFFFDLDSLVFFDFFSFLSSLLLLLALSFSFRSFLWPSLSHSSTPSSSSFLRSFFFGPALAAAALVEPPLRGLDWSPAAASSSFSFFCFAFLARRSSFSLVLSSCVFDFLNETRFFCCPESSLASSNFRSGLPTFNFFSSSCTATHRRHTTHTTK